MKTNIEMVPWRGPARRDRRGTAALEFALVMPVLIIVLLALFDVSNAVIVWWELSATAAATARIVTISAATASGTNVLSTDQATTASTAIFAIIPTLATAPVSLYGVTISSVVMTPTVAGCTANCSYVANVAWSLRLQGVAATRPCGQLGAVADGTRSSIGTLPIDAFSSSPLVVVDVTYNFVPLFNAVFSHSLTFMESAYMATRTGDDTQWVRLTGSQAAQAQCPGYT